MSYRSRLTQTLTRRRVTSTPVGDGSFTETVDDQTFRGQLVRRAAREVLIGRRAVAVEDRCYYDPTLVDLRYGDRIVHGDAEYDVSEPYTVRGSGVAYVDLARRV